MTPEQMEAHTRREDDARDNAALESAWDKIYDKIYSAKAGSDKLLAIKFTLLELKMLRQFRRKFV